MYAKYVANKINLLLNGMSFESLNTPLRLCWIICITNSHHIIYLCRFYACKLHRLRFDWMFWCLAPTLVVFQLYRGENTFDILDTYNTLRNKTYQGRIQRGAHPVRTPLKLKINIIFFA